MYDNDSYQIAALTNKHNHQYRTTAHVSLLKSYHLPEPKEEHGQKSDQETESGQESGGGSEKMSEEAAEAGPIPEAEDKQKRKRNKPKYSQDFIQ